MSSQIIQGTKGIGYGLWNPILRATSDLLRPKWLMFIVTDRCNSRCVHCDIWRREPTKALMPKEIKTALSDPLFRGLKSIFNSGGEPTMRDDLEEILLIEHELFPKAKLQLSTNGLLPERVIDVVKSAIKHNINIDVGVSLDGIGEKHDSIRGVKGNFEKADRLLHELVVLRKNHGHKIGLAAGITLSDLTLDSLEDVRVYTQKLKIDLVVQWYNEAQFYGNVGENLTTDNQNFVKAVQSLPCSIVRELWLKFLRGNSIRFPCYAMHTFCVLQPNGDIVPCLTLWDVKAGNVRESSPKSIWHSTEAKEARKIVKGCQGCLNNWGAGWSFASRFYPYLWLYLKHPRAMVRYLRER